MPFPRLRPAALLTLGLTCTLLKANAVAAVPAVAAPDPAPQPTTEPTFAATFGARSEPEPLTVISNGKTCTMWSLPSGHRPHYPPQLVRRQVEGDVVLRLRIDEEGVVQEAEIISEAHRLFGRNARDTALEWRFTPLICEGKPERFVLTLTFEFRLNT